jgi:hypothetical protein
VRSGRAAAVACLQDVSAGARKIPTTEEVA